MSVINCFLLIFSHGQIEGFASLKICHKEVKRR